MPSPSFAPTTGGFVNSEPAPENPARQILGKPFTGRSDLPATAEVKVERVEGKVVQPGEYSPEIGPKMLAYFDRPKYRQIFDTYTWKTGAVTEKVRDVPNRPPHFSEFARSIGVTTRKLKSWARNIPEFREYYEKCEEIFEEFLIDNGLMGGYGPQAMIFVAKNKTSMKDKVIHENQSIDLNKILDQIASGKVRPGGLIDDGDDYDK